MTSRAYSPRRRGLPLVDFGNEACGVFAFGNIATGVFAFGNVARGVVAVGNLAMGVFAAGNVGCGIGAGAGATVGIGLWAAAGCVALPVIDGAAGIVALNEELPFLALLPVAFWAVIYAAMRPESPVGEPAAPRPEGRVTDLLEGRAERAWVRVRALDLRGDVVVFAQGGREHSVRVERGYGDLIADAGAPVEGVGTAREVDLELLAVAEPVASGGGYRDVVQVARSLEVRGVRAVPAPARPWRSEEDLKAFWARLWLWGAVCGAASALARMVM